MAITKQPKFETWDPDLNCYSEPTLPKEARLRARELVAASAGGRVRYRRDGTILVRADQGKPFRYDDPRKAEFVEGITEDLARHIWRAWRAGKPACVATVRSHLVRVPLAA